MHSELATFEIAAWTWVWLTLPLLLCVSALPHVLATCEGGDPTTCASRVSSS